jgi:hypothetical protein
MTRRRFWPGAVFEQTTQWKNGNGSIPDRVSVAFLSNKVSAVSSDDAVSTTIACILKSPEVADDVLAKRLVASGIETDIAHRLVVLVPLAFSRTHYDSVPMKKEYAEEFIVFDRATEKEKSYAIATDPLFRAAAGAANRAANEDNKATVLLIARRSAEYLAINNVLSGLPDGALPKRIGTSPPVIVCGEPRPRPWWKLW